jgi:hypothetical protein
MSCLKCGYCGKFVSMKEDPHYLDGPSSYYEPPDAILVCKKCYEAYRKARPEVESETVTA